MCGIAGIFSLDAVGEDVTLAVEKMTEAQVHRGPDDWGVVSLPRGVMGHRRLSIVQKLLPAYLRGQVHWSRVWVLVVLWLCLDGGWTKDEMSS